MVFKNLCVLMRLMKVASALEELGLILPGTKLENIIDPLKISFQDQFSAVLSHDD